MTHRVTILPTALEDLEEIARRFDGRTETAGPEWLDRLLDHVFSLDEFPTRCAIASEETGRLGIEVRCLLFGKSPNVRRILFTVDGSDVHILHVLHGARDR